MSNEKRCGTCVHWKQSNAHFKIGDCTHPFLGPVCKAGEDGQHCPDWVKLVASNVRPLRRVNPVALEAAERLLADVKSGKVRGVFVVTSTAEGISTHVGGEVSLGDVLHGTAMFQHEWFQSEPVEES